MRYSLGNFVHAMKTFPSKLGAVETVCFTPGTGGDMEVTDVQFMPTVVRRHADKEHPKAFQAVPLWPALEECSAEEKGPLGISRGDCTMMKEFGEYLEKHPDLIPVVPSATE